MDPLTMALAAMLGGSALNSTGSILGGILGQQNNSSADLILPTTSTRSNLELAGSNFDALNRLGFGDINNVPSPFAQLVDQINGLAVDEKTKRRALRGLQQYMSGEKVTMKTYLKSAMTKVGMSLDDLPGIQERDAAFKQQQQELSGQLSGINTDTVLNRAQAGNAAAQLIGAAGNTAIGGERTDFQNMLLNRINRGIDDSEERVLLQGRFGGFNPSQGLEGIADLRADAELRAIEQSLFQASNITQALNGSLKPAQDSAGLSTNTQMGALDIAARQAAQANYMNEQTNANNATSMANGVSGGFGAFGDLFSNLGGFMLGSTAPAAQ